MGEVLNSKLDQIIRNKSLDLALQIQLILNNLIIVLEINIYQVQYHQITKESIKSDHKLARIWNHNITKIKAGIILTTLTIKKFIQTVAYQKVRQIRVKSVNINNK
jgi:hypothetical protein